MGKVFLGGCSQKTA